MPGSATLTVARYTSALISGALLPLSFAPLSWWPVAVISCASLYILLSDVQFRRALLSCLLYGVGLYATGASWIFVSIHQYGQASAFLSTLLTGVFVTGLGLIFVLPFGLYTIANRSLKPFVRPLLFSAIWVLGEWFRGWFLTGFPWLYLGYGFIDTWLAGWAPLIGVLGISGIVAYSGATIGNSVCRPTDNSVQRSAMDNVMSGDGVLPQYEGWRGTSVTALLVLTLWLCGNLLGNQSWTEPATKTALKVALVQPNNPVLSKWDTRSLPSFLANIRTTTQSLSNHDLVVWPESAIPAVQHKVAEFLVELDNLANEHQVGVITGIPTSSASGKYFNSVIGLGTASGTYQKRHLVPFGEYVPMEGLLRGLINFFDLPMSSFSPGDERQTMIKAGSYNITTAICYEIAYSEMVAKDSKNAHLLLTVSNDTWFGNSLGPHQHLQIARMRALETGKPLIRATNDGITAFISARGEVTDVLTRSASGVLSGLVLPRRGSTPYNRWGSMPTIITSLAIMLWSFALLTADLSRNEHSV
jgi:apolipoprotein N-acyltransferase